MRPWKGSTFDVIVSLHTLEPVFSVLSTYICKLTLTSMIRFRLQIIPQNESALSHLWGGGGNHSKLSISRLVSAAGGRKNKIPWWTCELEGTWPLKPGRSHRCMWYLRCQPPHGFFLAPPHLRGPGTAASSQGAVSGLRLRQGEPLSIWTWDNTTRWLFSVAHSQNYFTLFLHGLF